MMTGSHAVFPAAIIMNTMAAIRPPDAYVFMTNPSNVVETCHSAGFVHQPSAVWSVWSLVAAVAENIQTLVTKTSLHSKS
jgi:hypothetical protein